jgi:hypothetical protein
MEVKKQRESMPVPADFLLISLSFYLHPSYRIVLLSFRVFFPLT